MEDWHTYFQLFWFNSIIIMSLVCLYWKDTISTRRGVVINLNVKVKDQIIEVGIALVDFPLHMIYSYLGFIFTLNYYNCRVAPLRSEYLGVKRRRICHGYFGYESPTNWWKFWGVFRQCNTDYSWSKCVFVISKAGRGWEGLHITRVDSCQSEAYCFTCSSFR